MENTSHDFDEYLGRILDADSFDPGEYSEGQSSGTFTWAYTRDRSIDDLLGRSFDSLKQEFIDSYAFDDAFREWLRDEYDWNTGYDPSGTVPVTYECSVDYQVDENDRLTYLSEISKQILEGDDAARVNYRDAEPDESDYADFCWKLDLITEEPEEPDEDALSDAISDDDIDYVEAHLPDFEDDVPEIATNYFSDAVSHEMRQLLLDNGAQIDMYFYEDMRLAVETVNWSVINLDSDLQQELWETWLQRAGLTEEAVLPYIPEGCPFDEYEASDDRFIPLYDPEDAEDDDDEDERPRCISAPVSCTACGWHISQVLGTLRVYREDEEIQFETVCFDDPAREVQDLASALGYDVIFEGGGARHDVVGVYYIE